MKYTSPTTNFLLTASLLLGAAPVLAQTPPIFSLNVSPDLAYAGDTVMVSVIPSNFSASSTNFTWFRDGLLVPDAGGLTRSNLTITTDPSRSQIIQVRVVVDPGQEFSPAEQSTAISTLPSPRQQQEALSGIASNFTLQASTESPSPGESVALEVVTFAFDKGAASYQWYVNGAFQKQSSGRGETRFTAAAGGEGERKTVRVDVTTPSGQFRSRSVTLRTTSAILYWWADTSVPYWYKGKALPSLNSQVHVTALTSLPTPELLSYRWEFNSGVLPQSSGIGKRTLSFALGFPVEEEIGVTITDALGTLTKTLHIGIRPASPAVGIYAVKPLIGVQAQRQAGDFQAPAGDSYNFLAVPFFFPREREQSLRYEWQLNGKVIPGAGVRPWRLVVKSNAGEQSLNNQIGVQVSDPVRGGERVSASLRASFQ